MRRDSLRQKRMPQAFSDDLRCRILRAYECGGVSLRELAERFRRQLGLREEDPQTAVALRADGAGAANASWSSAVDDAGG